MSKKLYFGVPLDSFSEAPPLIVKKAIEYLNGFIGEEGIFRVGAQGSRVEELKAGWDNGTMTTFTEKNPHNVAAVLKHYFKELPEPLFISETYGKFNELVDEEDMTVKLQKLHELVECQPPNHLKTARFLFDFLKRLADNSSINKMTPSNIAAVFGSNILRPKNETFGGYGSSAIVTTLIENYDRIFFDAAILPPPPLPARQGAADKFSYLLPEDGETEDGFIGGKRAEQIAQEAANAPHTVEELTEGGRLYNYREGSYSVVTRLYTLCNIGMENSAFLRNKEQVKFISRVVKDLYQLRTLGIDDPAPVFDAGTPPQFSNSLPRDLTDDFLDSIVATLTDSLEKIADGVEELANALSQVELFQDMQPLDRRLRDYYAIARHLNILSLQDRPAEKVIARRPPPSTRPNISKRQAEPLPPPSSPAPASDANHPALPPPSSQQQQKTLPPPSASTAKSSSSTGRQLIPSTLTRPIDHLITQLRALKGYLANSPIDFFMNRPTIKLIRTLNSMQLKFLGINEAEKDEEHAYLPQDTSIQSGLQLFGLVIEVYHDLQLAINANMSAEDAQKVAKLIKDSTDAVIDHNRALVRHLKQQQDEIK